MSRLSMFAEAVDKAGRLTEADWRERKQPPVEITKAQAPGEGDRTFYHRGKTIVGRKVMSPVKWRGEQWFFLDASADLSFPEGISYVLLSGDQTQNAYNVPVSEVEPKVKMPSRLGRR